MINFGYSKTQNVAKIPEMLNRVLIFSMLCEKHHAEKESVIANYKKRKILGKWYNSTSEGKKNYWSLKVPSITN